MKKIKSIPRLPISIEMLKKHYSFYKKYNDDFKSGQRLFENNNLIGDFIDNFLFYYGYQFNNFNSFKKTWEQMSRFAILINGELKKEYLLFEKNKLINDFNLLNQIHKDKEHIEIIWYLKNNSFNEYFSLVSN